jgi:hypothetical protein
VVYGAGSEIFYRWAVVKPCDYSLVVEFQSIVSRIFEES